MASWLKPYVVVAPLVLHLPAEEIASKHLADTGVLGGIISGAIAAYMFNRFYRIKLPEYLGFFAGKRFVPIISGPGCHLYWRCAVLHLTADWFCNPDLLSVGCLPEPGSCVWHLRFHRTLPWYRLVCTTSGTYLSRCRLVNTPTQQVRFSTATFRVIWRVTRLRVNCLVASCSKCTVCQLPQLLSGTLLNQKNRAKVGGIMISAALTSFLTGITEPIEFSFMFVAPILYIIHAILAGPAFPICILLGMRDGTSFSHGLIDFIVLSGNSSKLWLFPIVGIGYAIVYYTIFRVLIKALDLKNAGS